MGQTHCREARTLPAVQESLLGYQQRRLANGKARKAKDGAESEGQKMRREQLEVLRTDLKRVEELIRVDLKEVLRRMKQMDGRLKRLEDK